MSNGPMWSRLDDAKDAARHRWLRAFILRWGWWPSSLDKLREDVRLTQAEWDAAIDAAMPFHAAPAVDDEGYCRSCKGGQCTVGPECVACSNPPDANIRKREQGATGFSSVGAAWNRLEREREAPRPGCKAVVGGGGK